MTKREKRYMQIRKMLKSVDKFEAILFCSPQVRKAIKKWGYNKNITFSSPNF